MTYITIEKEKMEKVLEALELSSVIVDSFGLQKKMQEAHATIKQALESPTVQEPVAWVLLREDEDGFEPIQFYGGKEKPETAAGELKPRFTLRPVCFADTTPSAQPAPEPEEDLYDLAVKSDNGGQP